MEYTEQELANEEWRDVVGWEGLYQVSNLGRVKSLPRHHKTLSGYITAERILTPALGKRGYLVVVLFNHGIAKTRPIHRLIAEAFIPNTEDKPYIDHINTVRTDNRIENLRWVTSKENSNNPITLDRNRRNCIKMWGNGCFDDRNNTHYRRVAQCDKDGNIIKIWDSIKEAEASLGIDASSISAICLGTNPHRHTAGGYKWVHIGGHYIMEDNDE